MGLFNRFGRKKEDKRSRTAQLLRTGRIVEGRILDLTADGDNGPAIVFYSYNIHGVEYESSQTLNAQQQGSIGKYAPGARVSIRYDPRQPANSIVV